jgi:hypothetical protein
MDTSNNMIFTTPQQIHQDAKKEKIDKRKKRHTNNEECIELKNIEYKNMLMKAGPITGNVQSNYITNEENLNFILDTEKETTDIKKPWNKLTNLTKIQKLNKFAETYITNNDLSNREEVQLKKYLKECLDRKRLTKIKDINYDKEKEEIISIPGLIFNKINKNFTFKNIDKKNNSTKSLGPKKKINIE